MKKSLFLLTVYFLCLYPMAAFGSEELVPLKEKVWRSDLVAIGTVSKVTLGEIRDLDGDDSSRVQYTYINFRIEECIVGNEKQDIIIEAHSFGFLEGNMGQASTVGFLNFGIKEGQRFVAYLKKKENKYVLTGESNQYFETIDDKAKTVRDEGQTGQMVPLDWKKQQLRELAVKREAMKKLLLPQPTSFPLRKEADAGILVTNLARQKQIKLEDYQQPHVEFEVVQHSWIFFYILKPPGMPGGHFRITVYENGKTKFAAGE